MFMTTYGTFVEVSDQKKWHYLENGVEHVKTNRKYPRYFLWYLVVVVLKTLALLKSD